MGEVQPHTQKGFAFPKEWRVTVSVLNDTIIFTGIKDHSSFPLVDGFEREGEWMRRHELAGD